MKVRNVQASDISATAEILATCNKKDTLGLFIYKDVEKYPTSYHLCHVNFLKEKYLAVGTVSQVVETEPSDYPEGEQHRAPEVIGFSIWNRRGKSDAAKKWQAPGLTYSARLERALLDVHAKYYKMFPSAQPTFNGENFAKILPVLMTAWDKKIFAEAWELRLLFVHPDWHRRGVGKKLMKWGFETAQEEKVPVIVKSSPMGAAAYRAAGFRPIKELPLMDHFDQLTLGGETSKSWVWTPVLAEDDTVEGQWYERAIASVVSQQEDTKA